MDANSPVRSALGWLGRLLLVATFVYAGANKILDPAGFVTDIGHYRLLPYPLAVALGLYLPWLEVLCGVAVLIRRVECGALALLLGLCVIFAGAVSSALIRGLDINCGCFGHGDVAATPLWFALARSVVLGLIAFWLLRQKVSPSPIRTTPDIS